MLTLLFTTMASCGLGGRTLALVFTELNATGEIVGDNTGGLMWPTGLVLTNLCLLVGESCCNKWNAAWSCGSLVTSGGAPAPRGLTGDIWPGVFDELWIGDIAPSCGKGNKVTTPWLLATCEFSPRLILLVLIIRPDVPAVTEWVMFFNGDRICDCSATLPGCGWSVELPLPVWIILTGESTGLGNMFGPAALFDAGCACITSCAGLLLFALFFCAICGVGLLALDGGAVCVCVLFGTCDDFVAPAAGVPELLLDAGFVFLSSLVSKFNINTCTTNLSVLSYQSRPCAARRASFCVLSEWSDRNAASNLLVCLWVSPLLDPRAWQSQSAFFSLPINCTRCSWTNR